MLEILRSAPDWSIVAAGAGIVELGLQLWSLSSANFRPVGDEYEYIRRGGIRHPFVDDPFFRVPLLPAIAWLCGRFGDPVLGLRFASILFSSVAVAATAGTAALIGGTGAAIVLTLILLMIPERFILGSRIWPDVALAGFTSGILLALSSTPDGLDPERAAAAIGALVAAATLTRIDALVLIPTASAMWALARPSVTPTEIFWIAGVPAIVFAAWWTLSVMLFRQRWPDTTWQFNLGVAAEEARVQEYADSYTVDELILGQQASADGPPPNVRSSWTAHLASIAARCRSLTGPDTFVRGKLIEDTHRRSGTARTALETLLRWSVPFVLSVGLVVVVLRPTSAVVLAIPALSLMAPAVMFHARTRNRLPLIYGLVPTIAGSVARVLTHPLTMLEWTVGGVVAVILCAILARVPRRVERPWVES